jgi:flagellar basal-body rod modification protein FlgD
MPINTDYQAQNRPSITTSTAIMGKGVDSMGMEDFFNLLMAQMTNQDIMNPQDNTQMVAQMAQFSSLQAMNGVLEATTALSEYQQLAYATNYVGKNVTIAEMDENDKITEVTGTVEKVIFYDGKPMVVVNGTAYELHKVMQVNATDASSPTSPGNTANSLQQATSAYLGKYVVLDYVDDDGEPHSIEGYVDSVMLKAGKPHVMIDGESYPADSIMNVYNSKEDADKARDDDDDSTDTGAAGKDETNGTNAVQGSRSYADLDPNKSYNLSADDFEALNNGTY